MWKYHLIESVSLIYPQKKIWIFAKAIACFGVVFGIDKYHAWYFKLSNKNSQDKQDKVFRDNLSVPMNQNIMKRNPHGTIFNSRLASFASNIAHKGMNTRRHALSSVICEKTIVFATDWDLCTVPRLDSFAFDYWSKIRKSAIQLDCILVHWHWQFVSK